MSKQKISFVFLLILFGCQDIEIGMKDYSRIETEQVTDINTDGVQFSAKILDIGMSTILDFGFVWGTRPSPTLSDYKISAFQINPDAIVNLEWAARVTSDISTDRMYVRSYIQSENYLVYGNEVEFIGKGSSKPQIIGFAPESSKFGGVNIVIKGEYFSQKQENVKVILGDEQLQIIYYSPDSLIALSPPVKKSGSYKISVDINGVQSISNKFFNMIYPWEKVADFPEYERQYPFSFTIDSNAYVGGGTLDNYGPARNDFYKYDPLVNNWTRIQDFQGVARHSASCINQRGLVFSGLGKDGMYNITLDDAWQYDPNLNQWSELINFNKLGIPKNIVGNTSVEHNNLLYVYLFSTNQFWVYNYEKESWDQLSSPALPMEEGYVDPYYWLRFGMSRNDDLVFFSTNLIWSYNPNSDSWSQINKKGVGIYDFKGISEDGKAYFIGSHYSDVLIEYDFENGLFINKGIIPNLHYYMTTFILNDNFYIGLGQGPYSSFYGEFWRMQLK